VAAAVETREECEVAIVGAGPAGCTAAAILAELGHDVLLIDQSDFPRDKPCGDGVGGPAVELAARLGLGALLAAAPEVRSTRIVVGHRRVAEIPFAAGKGQVLPRCVRRREFDAALQAAALERGVRFRRARVASLERGERRQRLAAVDADVPVAVEAGFAIAADGATSRLRRQVRAATERPRAYAIRGYYRTEKPVEPVFRCDLPVEVDGRILPGYGWVFPIDEHTVNVGVGSNYIPHQEVPSLRRVLDIYVDQLRTKSARQVGDLEALGPPLGSPVGVRRRIEIAGDPGLALVGDAAGTTSPITGEGISFAMRGAEELARELHRKDRRRGAAPPAVVEGNVWRAFPQVGIDTSAAIRVATLRANQAPSAAASVRSPAGPFLEAIWRMLPKSAYGTGIAETPAWAALSDCDRALGASLERVNDLLLERLADPMPFVTEVIHDSIRGHLGPMYAAAVLATAGDARAADEAADAGISAEVVGVLPKLLTMLVDRASSRQLKLNNAWAVLAGDFAATRSLSAAAKLGPAAVSALSRACQRGCAGGMLDTAARYTPDRTPESWLEAARETEGSAMVLATEFGAMVMGEDVAAAAPLREFGLELGVAVRLAEEIVELCGDAGDGAESDAHTLDRGIYSLPVLYATRAEPTLSRLLVQHAAEGDRGAEIATVVTESGALGRAVSECGERAERARACAESWTGNDGRALAALASLPLEYVAARTSADAPSACR
jgi:geranylgeranyl reductase family protein